MQNAEMNDFKTEHSHWLNELTLWHNELMFYGNVLVRFASLDVPVEDTDKMEEFKSHFDIMQEKLAALRAALETHATSENHNGTAQDYRAGHEALHQQIQSFEKDFKALKNEFFIFSDKEDY